MADPLISVIVPIYKVERYLNKCIESIVNQTYKNLEIILVDDGSPDRCPQMCDEWKEKDDRIVVVHKENGGLSDARNAGLDIATGEYISFVDSDDWVDHHFIEFLFSVIFKTNSDIVECEKVITTDITKTVVNDTVYVDNTFNNEEALKLLITDKVFHQTVWNKLYKKKVIDNIYFEKGKTNEDEFWTYQIFGNAKKISKLTNQLYFYFQRECSIMGRFNLRRLDALEAKWERQKYINSNYPNLSQCSLHNLNLTLIFLGQMTLSDLSDNDKKEAKTVINDYRKKINYSIKNISNISGRDKLWPTLSLISFWGTCWLKNKLRRI